MANDNLPEIVDGKLRLSNIRGDETFRTWRKGDTVRIRDGYYKIASAKPTRSNISVDYVLQAATEEDYRSRAARVKLSHFGSGDSKYAAHEIGRCVPIGEEWLHIAKIEPDVTRAAGLSGVSYWGVGKFVPAEKAAKLNAKWGAAERIRGLKTDVELATGYYAMHTPAEVQALRDELRKAQKDFGPEVQL